MNPSELKQEVLSALDTSPLQTVFPAFCARARIHFEQAVVTESDEKILRAVIEALRNPDEWFAQIAERTPTDTLVERIRSLGNSS